jgi:hypothetical protein
LAALVTGPDKPKKPVSSIQVYTKLNKHRPRKIQFEATCSDDDFASCVVTQLVGYANDPSPRKDLDYQTALALSISAAESDAKIEQNAVQLGGHLFADQATTFKRGKKRIAVSQLLSAKEAISHIESKKQLLLNKTPHNLQKVSDFQSTIVIDAHAPEPAQSLWINTSQESPIIYRDASFMSKYWDDPEVKEITTLSQATSAEYLHSVKIKRMKHSFFHLADSPDGQHESMQNTESVVQLNYPSATFLQEGQESGDPKEILDHTDPKERLEPRTNQTPTLLLESLDLDSAHRQNEKLRIELDAALKATAELQSSLENSSKKATQMESEHRQQIDELRTLHILKLKETDQKWQQQLDQMAQTHLRAMHKYELKLQDLEKQIIEQPAIAALEEQLAESLAVNRSLSEKIASMESDAFIYEIPVSAEPIHIISDSVSLDPEEYNIPSSGSFETPIRPKHQSQTFPHEDGLSKATILSQASTILESTQQDPTERLFQPPDFENMTSDQLNVHESNPEGMHKIRY